MGLVAAWLPSHAQHELGKKGYAPRVAPASDEGQNAILSFRHPADVRVRLYAAEPLLANPVSFVFDDLGRCFVAETFRLHAGVTDIRGHMNWLDDDLASRTVQDRVRLLQKHLSPEEFAAYAQEHDRLKVVLDTDGDGVADDSAVFADGFHAVEAGIGAGVLARGREVLYTCIPGLYQFEDADLDQKPDRFRTIQEGFGIHIGFLGHDLHGLALSPEGDVYLTIGDRGLNLLNDASATPALAQRDTGSVLRYRTDGGPGALHSLEIVATGLRNPQELAFDAYANAFTVDNNSDSGDRARLVWVVPGGDSGWRIGYQFIESPVSRGPWNAEHIWEADRPDAERPAHLVPPLANFSDGPSGLTYNPGVTRLPDRYLNHFFLADFRGATTTSGVRAFTVKSKGAAFELASNEEFLWGLQATDVDFGPDGSLYVSDWVEGWNTTGKGRIYRLDDEARAADPRLPEVQQMLREGMDKQPISALQALLGHDDLRIRRAAHLALELQGVPGREALARVLADPAAPQRARIHALWGLGRLARAADHTTARDAILPVLQDPDPELRTQAARMLRDMHPTLATPAVIEGLIQLAADPGPRVRFFAALALGKLTMSAPHPAVPEALVKLLEENGDRDPYLRHAGALGLAEHFWNQYRSTPWLVERREGSIHRTPNAEAVAPLTAAASHASPAVRLGVLLAFRRLESADVAKFLHDSDPRIRAEAARAIMDTPIPEALPQLAALADQVQGADASMLRRIAAANRVLGDELAAKRLVALATRPDVSTSIQTESIKHLADWSAPAGRDPITGLWRPIPPRSGTPATQALTPAIAALLESGSDLRRSAAASAAGKLMIASALPGLERLLLDQDRSPVTRNQALLALARLQPPHLIDLIHQAVDSDSPFVRTTAVRILAEKSPDEAIRAIDRVLRRGTLAEKQGAFATLGGMANPASEETLLAWLDRLDDRQIPAELRLDLLQAAAKRGTPPLQARLAQIETARDPNDPLAAYRDSLVGGNAQQGYQIFHQRSDVYCVRCHKLDGAGGEVGPELNGIGAKKDRTYLLEAIVLPNKQIAEGFETLVVATTDGQIHAGVVKGNDGRSIRLITPEATLIEIPQDQVEETRRGASAMPEDLHKKLTPFDLRDLIEYLASKK
jgi:quinoprotein glucose dehydrogenase